MHAPSQRLEFGQYYLIAMMVCWWSSGMAYMVSACCPPATVLMTGVFVALILGAFLQVCLLQGIIERRDEGRA